jgi:hypothetical protein
LQDFKRTKAQKEAYSRKLVTKPNFKIIPQKFGIATFRRFG